MSNGATLAYDPLGRLYQVTLGTSTTRFLYDGDALVEEYNGAGTLLRRHAYWEGADVPVATFDVSGGTGLGTLRYLFADEHGSIIAEANGSGAVTHINTYDEQGIPASTNVGRFQYTGQAWLPELGMYYYKARIYSPTLGRFLQTDPIGYEGGTNLYGYVGNDPVNLTDPSGLDPPRILTGSRLPVRQDIGPGLCGGCSGTSTASITGNIGRGDSMTGSIDTYKVGDFDRDTKMPVGTPWIEVRGTGGLAGFFLTSAEGGFSRCRWDPLVCELWANREMQGRMIRSWAQANTGPEALENEHSFWITRLVNGFVAGPEIIGSGPLTFGIMAQRPPGATILFHTHNIAYLSPGLSGLDSMLLRRNPFILVILSRDGWAVWESPLMRGGR